MATKSILAKRLTRDTFQVTTTENTKDFLYLHFGDYKKEAFICVFLDNDHNLISMEEMFYGTFNKAAIFPCEVLKRALVLNASAVIFVHNHPHAKPTPSKGDKSLTELLKGLLKFVRIEVLDHFVIGCDEVASFKDLELI